MTEYVMSFTSFLTKQKPEFVISFLNYQFFPDFQLSLSDHFFKTPNSSSKEDAQ